MNPLLLQEIQNANSDEILSAVIRKHNSKLVMGTYFDGADFVTPTQSELCLDALFQRTYEYKYWAKESAPLAIQDVTFKALQFPRKELSTHLSDYFTNLESSRARAFFDKNNLLVKKIAQAFAKAGHDLNGDYIPVLAVLVVNNDTAMLAELLPQIFIQRPIEIEEFIKYFLQAFDKKQFSALNKGLREEGIKYCARFLTAHDELLYADKYKEYWGDSPEAQEQFLSFSLKKFWSDQQQRFPHLVGKNIEHFIADYNLKLGKNLVPQILDWELNIPLLAAATLHSGYFNALQDLDGSIRRTRLVARHGNNFAPSLALKAFLVSKGYQAKLVFKSEFSSENLPIRKLGGIEIEDQLGHPVMKIPTDPLGRMMINYAGPQHMFPHVSATQILDPSETMTITWRYENPKTGEWVEDYNYKVNKKEFLKNRVVILGATAIGVYDLRVTPFEGNFAGVETHANVLSNLFIEDQKKATIAGPKSGDGSLGVMRGFLREPVNEGPYMLGAILILGLVLSFILSRMGPLAGLIIVILSLVGVNLLDQYLLLPMGVVINLLFPILLALALYTVLTFFKYFTEERKKRELKGIFAKYVSPTIVNEILTNPAGIEFGGKKMSLTVLFSDIKGFTSFSEELDPQELSDLLNNYLTPMTNLVFDNKGTLDKYIGDAIMAFWGAPLYFPDHANHAVRCALRMVEILPRLQAYNRSKGFPLIDIRVGINSGEMNVGNMGSSTIRSYTVMGDGVNLGSRMEGINKEYGTRIILSEYTYAQIKDSFICREIDLVLVAGKSWPVRVFEPLGEGAVAPPIEAMLKKYNEGLQLYRAQNFTEARESFQQALGEHPRDSVCQLYIKRCTEYLETPPPADWDGVSRLTK